MRDRVTQRPRCDTDLSLLMLSGKGALWILPVSLPPTVGGRGRGQQDKMKRVNRSLFW